MNGGNSQPSIRTCMATSLGSVGFWILDCGFWIADLQTARATLLTHDQSKIQNPKSTIASFWLHVAQFSECRFVGEQALGRGFQRLGSLGFINGDFADEGVEHVIGAIVLDLQRLALVAL